MAQLLILIIALLLVHPALVVEAQQVIQTPNPALPSGKTDKQGWPLPRWWQKYRQRFGRNALKKCKFLDDQSTTTPVTGDSCPNRTTDYFCLFGDAYCCDRGCEPAYRCDCRNNVFQCAFINNNNNIANPCTSVAPVCPKQKPRVGQVCTMPDSAIHCSYIDPNAASTGPSCNKVTDICQCENGVFTCAVSFVNTCVPASVANATAPSLEYTCPSRIPAQGAACTLTTYEPCTYGKGSCPGPNDGNGNIEVISFPDEICTCNKTGQFRCIKSIDLLHTLGCHQANPPSTSFPSASPI